MRFVLLLGILAHAAAAYADEPPAEGPPPPAANAETVERLTATARNLARDGRCEAIPAIAARVQRLDPDYYARVYAVDPAIAHCTPVDPRLQLGGPPSVTPPLRPSAPQLSAPLGPPPPAKSATTATLLSLGVTAAGFAMAEVGANEHMQGIDSIGAILFVVGPTTGHVYAGHTWNSGLGIRLVGAGAAVVGGLMLVPCIADGCGNGSEGDVGAALLIGGGLVYAGGTIVEIATAGEDAHRYNREHGIEATIVPTPRGIAVAGRF